MHRSVPVIILSCLFVVAGVIGILYHADDLKLLGTSQEAFWILMIRLLAIIGGVFAIRRKNWARWLLLAWISYHVVLSLYHPLPELSMHAVLLGVVVYVFFLSKNRSHFNT
jgi:hypothetical protein